MTLREHVASFGAAVDLSHVDSLQQINGIPCISDDAKEARRSRCCGCGTFRRANLAFEPRHAMLVAVSSKSPPQEEPKTEAEPQNELSDIRGKLARIRAELARRREATATSNERLERAQRLFTSAQSQVEDAEEVRTRTGEVPGRKRMK
jgi:hypothetical protein